MKKVLFMLALLPIFFFTSCSDDDDEVITVKIKSYEKSIIHAGFTAYFLFYIMF